MWDRKRRHTYKANEWTDTFCFNPLSQPQLFTTPHSTSGTTSCRPSSTSWMGENITPTSTWGKPTRPSCHISSRSVINPSLRFFFSNRRDLTSAFFTGRRIPLESIPEDEAECAAWLHKLYQEKVRVLKVGVLRGTHTGSHGELQSRVGRTPR